MTPGARISAVIEVLDKVDQFLYQPDEVVSSYFRGRRYIGSRDRRFISETIYSILRYTAHLNWLTPSGSSREKVIAYLIDIKQLKDIDILELFDGTGYSPPQLNSAEIKLISVISDKSGPSPNLPRWVQTEFPEWLYERMEVYWGKNFDEEANALNRPATIDLRVNTLKTDCTKVLEILKNDGLVATPTPHSPIGLRLKERRNFRSTTIYKGGFVELQDEGSQLIALLTDAKADHKTIDFCAGSGGKTLALAASMKDGGPLIACDTHNGRLKRLTSRLKRAGVSNVSQHHLTGPGDLWLEKHRASAERVLIDVPCSGSGAWRRFPGSKWQLTNESLQTYTAQQSKILDQASLLVRPGGRLIYATCSIFPQENENQVTAFLRRSKAFQVIPIGSVWQECLGGICPSPGKYLELTPARTQTDGFFCAVLKRMS